MQIPGNDRYDIRASVCLKKSLRHQNPIKIIVKNITMFCGKFCCERKHLLLERSKCCAFLIDQL